MRITFDDDAFDAYVNAVANIPEGYTVALLEDGAVISRSELVRGVDVRFVSADADGVTYREIDRRGEPTGDEILRPWSQIASVHVY